MIYYFDTSSLVKIYHTEQGTPDVLDIYKNHENTIIISEVCRIEFLSTIYRKYREKELTDNTLNALIQKFQDDADSRYEVLRFSSLVTDEAENLLQSLASKHSLKSLDSIQFSFFKIYCADNDTVFVCSDLKLGNLVKSEGFQVMIP